MPTVFVDRKRRVNMPSVNSDRLKRTAKRSRVKEEQEGKKEEAEVAAAVLVALSSSLHCHQAPFKDAFVQTKCM